MHISKKRVRLAIMDALHDVLKNDAYTLLSRGTKLTIVEAVEKITESVQRDFAGLDKVANTATDRARATGRTTQLRESSLRPKRATSCCITNSCCIKKSGQFLSHRGKRAWPGEARRRFTRA